MSIVETDGWGNQSVVERWVYHGFYALLFSGMLFGLDFWEGLPMLCQEFLDLITSDGSSWASCLLIADCFDWTFVQRGSLVYMHKSRRESLRFNESRPR